MNTLKIETELAEHYRYKPLPKEESERYRALFAENIPNILNEDGSNNLLFTLNGTPICKDYQRIVVGDYGAFVEFSESQAYVGEFIIKKGQEYRVDNPQYANNVKCQLPKSKELGLVSKRATCSVE